MRWRKDPNERYVDLCIFIDENISKIQVPGENPELENTIYNDLWLLVKALAIKKGMFNNFDDYDPYAFYAATRLFFALRKNLENQGKVIKGKEIRPIKSCLNYTKALLYPMKIEYQREAYREIIDEEFVSKKFDSFAFREQLKSDIRQTSTDSSMFKSFVDDTLKDAGKYLADILQKLPFSKDSVEYNRIKISILLNCLNSLQQKNKLNVELPSIILWKLPRSMTSYVRVLLKEFYKRIATELIECCEENTLDDTTVEKILNYKEGQDYEFDEQC